VSSRSFLWLAGVAVVAILLAVLGQRFQGTSVNGGDTVGSPLAPSLRDRLNDVERVTLIGAGNETRVSLVRGESGWSVAEHDGYPADVAKIRNALVALADATVVEEKTRDAAFYDRLGVEDIAGADASGVGVMIEAGGQTLPQLILGGEQGSNQRFARRAGEDLSLLIDANPDLPLGSAQWLLPDLIDIESARIQRIDIEHADGERLMLVKTARDDTSFEVADVPEGRELQYSTIANVTGNTLRDLRLDDARAMPAEAGDPDVTTRFYMFDGLVVTATSRNEDGANWLSFEAAFDPAQAADFAIEALDDGEVTGDAEGTSDAASEADSLNARLGSWQFRIPAHLHDQMTRRMEDLLRAPED
jgi:hypothetical protein